ncbi:MAG: DEAD/DEAH box helicase [Propionivibrio sp.]|uniref:DEAD/DEAH box helicase n=1 Tax=Propionivibrio sp. TaxID=2212460 RepID=UPI001A4DED8E|nr:DEAD/DEAH box helicase [Propionivibrio sp.]MBL8416076.1 DEAD/DEAH box helicase [Propionivibrio sp.]
MHCELRNRNSTRIKVDIFFGEMKIEGQPYLVIDSDCTCKTAYSCEHAAAALLFMLQQRAKSAGLRGSSATPSAALATVNPGLLHWVETLRRASLAAEKKPKAKAKATQAIYYLVGCSNYYQEFVLRTVKGRIDPAAPLKRNTSEWSNAERALLAPPQFTDDNDLDIFRLMLKISGKGYLGDCVSLFGKYAASLLAAALASGRCYFCPEMSAPHSGALDLLRTGPARPGEITWQVNTRQQIVPHLATQPPSRALLFLEPPWYLDPESGEAGPVESKVSQALLDALFRLSPLDPVDLPLVANALAEMAPDIPPPNADAVSQLRKIDEPLQPIITLHTLRCWAVYKHRKYAGTFNNGYYDYAEIDFAYGTAKMSAHDPQDYATVSGGETVRVMRNPEQENAQLDFLASLGFQPVIASSVSVTGGFAPAAYGLESEAAWAGFSTDLAPKLRAAGWQVVVASEFRHHVLSVESWDAELTESEAGWFGLDMGIVVDGERLPLAPLLHSLFRSDGRWLDGERMAHIADDEQIELQGPQGGRIRIAAERIKPLARTLIDLFDGPAGGQTLRLPRADAVRLAALGDLPGWTMHGTHAASELARRLQGAGGTHTALPPQGLALMLRPYQLDGLGWLQYLRENELGGILADDMGLGKTAQTLAHLLIEKEAGRLDKPALVIMPTSLIFNWKREAERFAPGLRVLSLHGPSRAERFASIPEHDVCLTTYPLLWRDRELLGAHAYHLLILDEAQIIKNSASQAAQVVRQFSAAHRLCLTGTPMENHLGELWGLFDFLMPGFLGNSKHFTSTWRTPIEKQGNTLRRALLARRIKPFMLRRKKDEVAKELPEKTIIVRSVELDGGQRDLYETVRSAMDARVREEIAAKGFARSQIVILDALLKLRQVCCDPRLVKIDAAKKVKERAKLDLLMDMLPEMIEEGRRVLLFSQFTSMLDLIADELTRRKLDFVTLTGSTTDRETPIRRFQAGEVPIFLISLKAGGTGLNLTAADTVIHYDPWWNPAVENQATDRAHRLGQSKKVFVYKLVVAGSIEEKILELQEKKAELAAGILSEDHEGSVKFSDADLAALLEPITDKGA